MVKCRAQGHRCHDQDSNPHSAADNPELGSGELDHLCIKPQFVSKSLFWSLQLLYNKLFKTTKFFINVYLPDSALLFANFQYSRCNQSTAVLCPAFQYYLMFAVTPAQGPSSLLVVSVNKITTWDSWHFLLQLKACPFIDQLNLTNSAPVRGFENSYRSAWHHALKHTCTLPFAPSLTTAVTATKAVFRASF